MRGFRHTFEAQRIVFGDGSAAQVADEVAALQAGRVVVITGGSAAPAGRRIAGWLGDRCAGVTDEVCQHVPRPLADATTATVRDLEADGLVSVGGGSATGLAKVVAVRLDIPVVAVPTTFSGSERTPIWATTGEHKHTARDSRALPAAVVYDPDLLAGLPGAVAASSGLNAIAQAVAALTHEPADPVARLHAEEAVRVVAGALDAAAAGSATGPRGEVLYGTCLGTGALAATGTGLHHRLAHVLGGTFRLTHADVHAALLPHTTARLPEGPGVDRLARALGADDPGGALYDLARRVDAPVGLAAVGAPPEAVEHAVDRLTDGPDPPDTGWLRDLLEQAHRGDRPPARRAPTGTTTRDREQARDGEEPS